MAFLALDDYATIRAAIDISLSSAALPDSIISMSIYQGAAELGVLARDPLAATRIGTDAQHIVNAVIYWTAALLVPAIPKLTREQFDTEYTVNRAQMDPLVQARTLRGLADAELDAVLAAGKTTPERPTMFALAHGCRGR
jgi:hypothetical protein